MTATPNTDERPAPASALSMARQAIAGFPWCFWFRGRNAPLNTISDVCLVVQRLRQHGNRQAWDLAYRIEQCL